MDRHADSNTRMIDLRYIKKLIDMLDGSSVDSVEISSDKGMKLRISKSPQRGTVQMATPVTVPALIPQGSPQRFTPTEGMPAIGDGDLGPSRPEPTKP
jgi:acetyl-CoA carboxylase biotin carboxyl carrier protein